MTKRNPLAFPAVEANGCNSGEPGMTLLDYFAAQAMQAIIANDQLLRASSEFHPDGSEASVAQIAYEQADAMMIERKKWIK